MTYDHRVKINGTWVEPGAVYTAPVKSKSTEKEDEIENRQKNSEPSMQRSRRKLDVE